MTDYIRTEDFLSEDLKVYTQDSEVQLLRYYEPEPGIFIAESPKVIRRAMDAGYEPMSFLIEEGQENEETESIFQSCGEAPVYMANRATLLQLKGYTLTRGMLSAMRRRELPSVEEICGNARRIAVLENVVNPVNVGAIFRSAAALNMDAVLLTGGCSDPLYRRAARVSMGTVFQIPWTFFEKGKDGEDAWPGEGMRRLRAMGFRTAALALREDSISIEDQRLKQEERLALILGTEGDGLAAETMADCDYIVRIPMGHGVDSLNVAAASAVAFWEVRTGSAATKS